MWPVCRLLVPNWSHNPSCKEHFGLTFGRKLVCGDDSIPLSQQNNHFKGIENGKKIIMKVVSKQNEALLNRGFCLCGVDVLSCVTMMNNKVFGILNYAYKQM